MKRKITVRLIFSNLIILVIALFCFYIASAYNINSQARVQAEQQILAENRTVIKQLIVSDYPIEEISDDSTRNPPPDEHGNFQPSFFLNPNNDYDINSHLFMGYDQSIGEFIFISDKLFLNDGTIINNDVTSKLLELENSVPTQITIEDEKYLVVLTEYLSDDTNGAVFALSFAKGEFLCTYAEKSQRFR